MYVMTKGKMAKGRPTLIEVTNKEARRLFVKFLLKNNCLKQYILCYRAQNGKKLTSKEIIDKTIHSLDTSTHCSSKFLFSIFEWGDISFNWYNDDVRDVMKNKYSVFAPGFWERIYDKFMNEYKYYKLVDFSNAKYFI